MKKKCKVLVFFSLFLLFISFSQSIGLAEEKENKQLLYDLKYDKDKSVLSGKSQPNANIFINDLAGSIVADDKGNFEVPIPKDFKTSTIRMLDAIGEESTDVTYDFEKNTVVTEETSATSNTNTSSNTDNTATSSNKDNEKDEPLASGETKNATSTSESDESDSSSNSKKASGSIVSESYVSDESNPVRSKAWIWTLVVIVVVIGSFTALYFWYKNKIEKEEKRKRTKTRKHAKKKTKKTSVDEVEDELYATLLDEMSRNPKSKSKNKGNRASDERNQLDLDELIDSEMKKKSVSNTPRRSSSRKKTSTKKKTKK